MSWMDSWSRPSKSQAAPPPFYLTQGDNARYCYSCGRIIGSRRSNIARTSATEVKYCSDKCKHNKPSAFDRSIENALHALLQSEIPAGPETNGNSKSSSLKSRRKPKKGDPRIVVNMSDLETAVFGDMRDPEKIYGRNKNRAKRGLPDPEDWQSVDMVDGVEQRSPNAVDDEHYDAGENDVSRESDMISINNHVRPLQLHSDVNGSVGGEKGWSEQTDETPEMLQKRLNGQKKAEDRERIRKAARRAVAFGVLVKEDSKQERVEEAKSHEVRRKCEALMSGSVVDPSFAKGDWSIRWRED